MARQRADALGCGLGLVVHGGAGKAHVVDEEPEARVARGDCADLREPLRRVYHHRNLVALGLRPEPVGGAVGEPRPVGIAVKGQPHAEHAGLLAPAREQIAPFASGQRKAPHDGEAVGMLLRGLQRIVVAVAFDRRRHQDGAVDTGPRHVGEQLLARVGRVLPALAVAQEHAVGPLGRPYVNLAIDDVHRHGARGQPAALSISATRGAK